MILIIIDILIELKVLLKENLNLLSVHNNKSNNNQNQWDQRYRNNNQIKSYYHLILKKSPKKSKLQNLNKFNSHKNNVNKNHLVHKNHLSFYLKNHKENKLRLQCLSIQWLYRNILKDQENLEHQCLVQGNHHILENHHVI